MQHFGGVWGTLLAFTVVLAGLATLACLIRLTDHSRRVPRPASREVARLDRAREWDVVMRRAAAQDQSRETAVLALQADSAVKIDAAEHAYKRLVADCARYFQASEAPTHDPVSLPVTREPEAPVIKPAPEETPERTPLAA